MTENPLKSPLSEEVRIYMAYLGKVAELERRKKVREREREALKAFNESEMERLRSEMLKGPHPWNDPSDPHNW